MDTLRPPEGYILDRAIGTTFTLDLMTLLAVPLAFTFRDAQDQDGQLATDPLSLLESARRYADKIVVFCHGGRTGVPRAGQPALAFIEDSVVAAFPPPRRHQLGGVFHPKVWVLRYLGRQGSGNDAVRYRLVCQSRNLTFDTSWDASLVLDGELVAGRVRGYSLNDPLSNFVRTLPSLASQPLSSTQEESLEVLSDELRRVRFEEPEGLKLNRFLSFGVNRTNPPYPDLEHRPLLVISPFLDAEFLRSIQHHRQRSVLISRRESLLTAPTDVVGMFDEVYAFRSGLEPEPEDSEDSLPRLAGLHAKIFVVDDGWDARVCIGSANSTKAALGNPPRNVEFMVEFAGRKSRFGIDALLKPPSQGEAGTFRSLIAPFDPSEAGTVLEDENGIHLERLLDGAAEAIAKVHLTAKVEASSSGRYNLQLKIGDLRDLPGEVRRVSCWPATLSPIHQRPLESGMQFLDLSLVELSKFLAIEIQATVGGMSGQRRFARTIEMTGLPEDRLPRLLATMLRDRERFMQLLWLLLSPDQEVSFGDLSDLVSDKSMALGWGSGPQGLLERMVETLAGDPSRLNDVASLIEDLRRTESGTELIGAEFDAIWEAIWMARGVRE